MPLFLFTFFFLLHTETKCFVLFHFSFYSSLSCFVLVFIIKNGNLWVGGVFFFYCILMRFAVDFFRFGIQVDYIFVFVCIDWLWRFKNLCIENSKYLMYCYDFDILSAWTSNRWIIFFRRIMYFPFINYLFKYWQ